MTPFQGKVTSRLLDNSDLNQQTKKGRAIVYHLVLLIAGLLSSLLKNFSSVQRFNKSLWFENVRKEQVYVHVNIKKCYTHSTIFEVNQSWEMKRRTPINMNLL